MLSPVFVSSVVAFVSSESTVLTTQPEISFVSINVHLFVFVITVTSVPDFKFEMTLEFINGVILTDESFFNFITVLVC